MVMKMKEYLEEYTKETEKLIKKGNITEKDIEKHLIKIKFFQHERLIHLLVTLFYAVFILLSLFIIFLIFLVFYVRHYFFLENCVQYLYKLYDKMLTIKKGK